MTSVLGVDGCPSGWCAIQLDTGSPMQLAARHYDTFAEILASTAAVVCIDIPIGLPFDGPRYCDLLARRFLGRPRSSSVFPPPCREASRCTDYSVANKENFRVLSRRVTRQTFGISRKIAEVDGLMTPDLQGRVREVHPEVCFRALAGRPMASRKATPEGRRDRWQVLGGVFEGLGEQPVLPPHLRGRCDLEDYIDALVAAHTAAAVVRGEAVCLPEAPKVDLQGLRMEIWHPAPSADR